MVPLMTRRLAMPFSLCHGVETLPPTLPPAPPPPPYRLCCNLSGGAGDRFIPFITLSSCKFIFCTCSEGENKTRRIFLWSFGNTGEIGGRGSGNGRREAHPSPTHHPPTYTPAHLTYPPTHLPFCACLPAYVPAQGGRKGGNSVTSPIEMNFYEFILRKIGT